MINGGIKEADNQGDIEAATRFHDHYFSPVLTPLRAQVIFLVLMVLIMAVSIAWRLGNLNAFSLSNDEGAYLMWAWLVHSGHPLYSETVSVSAPLFILALDWAFDLAGVSLVTGRALVLVFFGLAFISLAWGGRLLQDGLAGLMAAATFSLAPLAFSLSRVAIGEIPSVALASLAVTLALVYWRRGGTGWLALSGLTWSLSLLTKAMNPSAAVPIIWLISTRHWDNPKRWSAIVKAILVWGLAALLPVAICLLIYDPLALYDQAVAFRFELRETYAWLLADNVMQFVLFLKQNWGLVVMALAGAVLLACEARWDVLIAVGLWLATSTLIVLLHSPLFFHHTVILLPALVLMAGSGVARTVALLRAQRRAGSAVGAAGILALLLALPGTLQANQTVRTASFGREAEAIVFLSQVTSPADMVISDNLLLPFMAERQTPPPLGDLAQVAIDSGRQTSQRLIAISEAYPVEAVANWALRLPYLDEYMGWVERNYLVQRVWDNHHVIYAGRRVSEDQVPNRVDARLGDAIELLGYDIQDNAHQKSGRPLNPESRASTLDVTIYWQADRPVQENYHVFVQLLDQEGRLVAQHDGQPLHGYLPTSHWSPGDVIPDHHRLSLPDELPAGRYRLIAGMYVLETLVRLPARGAHAQGEDDYISLAEIQIG
ncbi:MAG: hypothetical protein Kow0063_05680 [Anaerolineae bacterium]